ncbi:MAG TPA: hypothetical protein VK348_12655, partial [Planctomycetota bacterium]|nr:hypothetical protein [Planctomycetota bacterium]
MNERERARDLRLDWALAERLRGERPPDLTARILARHRDGDGVVLAQRLAVTASPRWRAVRVAALLLLGLAVVVAAALLRHGDNGRDADATAGPQDRAREPARIASAAEAAALPADTRAVEAFDTDDATLLVLARLRELESLTVRYSWRTIFGLGLKVPPPKDPHSITDAGITTIAGFAKLRELHLLGAYGVTGATLQQLTRLPLLQSLTLAFFDVDDRYLAFLPQLPALQHLDLSFNYFFAEPTLATLARCQSLRVLSLRGCQQFVAEPPVGAAAIPQLEDLDLSLIDNMNGRYEPLPRSAEAQARVDELSKRAFLAPGGWGEPMLAALAKTPRLRRLDLSGCNVSQAALGQLADRVTLESLNVSGIQGLGDGIAAQLPASLRELSVCGEFTDTFCRDLRARLPALRHLDVSACYKITDAGAADLLAIRSLREIELRQMRGLTRGVLEPLAKATQLQTLDVRHCDFVTAGDVRDLRAALPDLKQLTSNFTAEELRRDEELNPTQVSSAEQMANLPAGLRSIQGNRLGDEDVTALVRFRELARLVLATPESRQKRQPPAYTDWATPRSTITDQALPAIARLGKLRHLSLAGNHGIRRHGLAELARLPLLEELDLSCFDLDDDALVEVSRLQHVRDLDLSRNHGFGERGLRAVAEMRGLHRLSLRGCSQLHDDWLATLGQLEQLTELDLGEIDGQHWRMATPLTARSSAFMEKAQAMAAQPGAGLGDEAMA